MTPDPTDIPSDDCAPFEAIEIRRREDPIGTCIIEGLRHGGSREIQVSYRELWDQASEHMRLHHGKTFEDPHTPAEFRHCISRAAVAFLID